jgi:cytochrome c553
VSVAGGPPGTRACGLCHLIDGSGKPDASPVNGLPIGYMKRQIEDFKTDHRFNSEPRAPAVTMVPVAKLVSDDEVLAALEYFHAIGPLKDRVRVVEVARVRKTHPTQRKLLAYDEPEAFEPIGNRVVEIGADPERAEMRDATTKYIAYVPKGAVAKGRRLAQTGGGVTQACQTCHGADLRGLGDAVPPIAGRSPTYLARQLYDFKTGARNGANAPMMKATVAKLSDADIVNLVAYAASLPQ